MSSGRYSDASSHLHYFSTKAPESHITSGRAAPWPRGNCILDKPVRPIHTDSRRAAAFHVDSYPDASQHLFLNVEGPEPYDLPIPWGTTSVCVLKCFQRVTVAYHALQLDTNYPPSKSRWGLLPSNSLLPLLSIADYVQLPT